ncbi:heterodisulfide reductase subunit B, partial [bacterium]|nr:heterodisulfide reductase subunit B [bacterium]
KERIKNSLNGMKIACYYGCLLTRPPEVTGFDSVEYPMSMDRILKKLGARTIDWSYKTECCGASLALTREDIVKKLCFSILENAKASGAEAIAVACPLCQSNLDLWQGKIEKESGKNFSMPILYFTQLLGIVLGIPSRELGLSKLMVSPYNILEQKGLM